MLLGSWILDSNASIFRFCSLFWRCNSGTIPLSILAPMEANIINIRGVRMIGFFFCKRSSTIQSSLCSPACCEFCLGFASGTAVCTCCCYAKNSFSSFLSIPKKNSNSPILSFLSAFCDTVTPICRELCLGFASGAAVFLYMLLVTLETSFSSFLSIQFFLSKIKSTAYNNVRRLHATILFLFHVYQPFFLMFNDNRGCCDWSYGVNISKRLRHFNIFQFKFFYPKSNQQCTTTLDASTLLSNFCSTCINPFS